VRGGHTIIINHGNKTCHLHTLEVAEMTELQKIFEVLYPHLWIQLGRVFHVHEHCSQNSGKDCRNFTGNLSFQVYGRGRWAKCMLVRFYSH